MSPYETELEHVERLVDKLWPGRDRHLESRMNADNTRAWVENPDGTPRVHFDGPDALSGLAQLLARRIEAMRAQE